MLECLKAFCSSRKTCSPRLWPATDHTDACLSERHKIILKLTKLTKMPPFLVPVFPLSIFAPVALRATAFWVRTDLPPLHSKFEPIFVSTRSTLLSALRPLRIKTIYGCAPKPFDFPAHFWHSTLMETHAFGFRLGANAGGKSDPKQF